MFDPVMQSPLHHLGLAAKAKPIDEICGVWAHEIALCGYVSLRGLSADADFLNRTEQALGAALPLLPCTMTTARDLTVLWLSPDEWLLTGTRDLAQSTAEELLKALAGVRSQVVVNSGGLTEIQIAGANAQEVLSHCTVYDLEKLAPGRVVGTTFGKSSVYMYRDGDGFRLLLRRSFADYIWRFLERAAAPYGFGVAKSIGHTA